MKTSTWQAAALATALLATQAGATEAPAAPALKTQTETISYSIGLQAGRQLRKDGVAIDADLLARGIRDGLTGASPLLSDKELRQVMGSVLAQVRQKTAEQHRVAAGENKQKEAEFLAANKAKLGVVALASGLQYSVLKEGSGNKPTDVDTVQVNYRGTLLDGTEFDASAQDQPSTLKVAMLIPGWKEALKLMPVGSRWQLFIPAQLAYGERGAGEDIGPNQTLVFDVELVAIK